MGADEGHGAMQTVRRLMHKHRALFAEVLTTQQKHYVERMASGSFLQMQGKAKGDAPSSEIFGILKQMKESFETNLASSQQEESANQKAYEEFT